LLATFVVCQAKIWPTNPTTNFINWDEATYLDIELHVGDSISFLTEWRAHTVFWTKSTHNQDKQWYAQCNTDAIIASADWQKFSCDCPGIDASLVAADLGACLDGTNTLGKICQGVGQTIQTFVPAVVPDVYTFTSSGQYYFVCSGGHGDHCHHGMKFRVLVDGDRRRHPITIPAPLNTHQNIWSFFEYDDVTISKGDQFRFIYTANDHTVGMWTGATAPNLPQDCAAATWDVIGSGTAGAAPNGFVTPKIEETTWFSCQIPGHCQAGMVFKATVKHGEGEGKDGGGEGQSKHGEGEGHH